MAREPKKARKSPATSRKAYRTACPVCAAKVLSRDLANDRFFPFCSRRCKLVDLGKWFDGEYCISRDNDEDEEDFDDEDDADEDGNLDGFIVPDKSESDEEDNGRPIPPSVPVVVKKRRS